jgi:hypothetical protein
MAKAGNSLAARLRKLDAALERAKKLPRGTTLTGQSTKELSMAEVLGVSWPVLRGWCKDVPGFEESGAFTRGGNGIDYEFKPVATVRFLIKHFTAERDARARKAREVRRMVAGDQLDGLPDEFDLDEIRKMIQVHAALREERQKAGELVEAGKLREALNGMMSEMQQAGVKAASQQDPTGQWPPEIREKFEDAINTVLVTMGRAGERVLKLCGGTA